MGCCGDREKGEFVKVEQRWDYINLDDFKTKSCWTVLAYGWLWLMLLVSISVYAVDTFTAVQLIAFDKWSGQVQPAIPFKYARWIFAGCIIASFVLLFYRWWRAVRVMKQGGVAKSYLDPLAVRVQCIRMGKQGRGYKRFLVFADLTKSRKGADYVALFAYFSFEAWLRIIFAEGPRQAINAITLYTVLRLKLVPEGDHAPQDGHSAFVQFWVNVGQLAEDDKLQAAILLGMLWTLLIWVLAALSLASSVILYFIFLWHHIPSHEGGLAKYCRNKINRRMERVVKVKVDKALKKENEVRVREEARAQREGLKLKTQPTLPDISADGASHSMSSLSRQNTMTTLPEYTSRPGSIRNSEDDVPPMPGPFNDPYRPGPKRHATQRSDTSWSSYNSNAPLISSAGDMGTQTPLSASSAPWPSRPMPSRNATGFSQYSERTTTPGPRPPTAQSGHSYQMEPLPRSGTSASNASHGSRSGPDLDPALQRGQTPIPAHPASAGAHGSCFPPVQEDHSDRYTPVPRGPGRSFTYQEPPTRSLTPVGQPPRSFTPVGGPPPRSFTPNGPPPRSFTPAGPPPRSFTPQGPPPNRSITPFDQPTLPRLDTSMSTHHPGYMPIDQRSATPASGNPANHNHYQAYQPQAQANRPQQEYQSYSRARDPSQPYHDQNRDSGVDDILNHYR